MASKVGVMLAAMMGMGEAVPAPEATRYEQLSDPHNPHKAVGRRARSRCGRERNKMGRRLRAMTYTGGF
jgi:hypothetical protein